MRSSGHTGSVRLSLHLPRLGTEVTPHQQNQHVPKEVTVQSGSACSEVAAIKFLKGLHISDLFISLTFLSDNPLTLHGRAKQQDTPSEGPEQKLQGFYGRVLLQALSSLHSCETTAQQQSHIPAPPGEAKSDSEQQQLCFIQEKCDSS